MKLIILGFAMASSPFSACNNSSSNSGSTIKSDTTPAKSVTATVQQDTASIQPVLTEYMKIKNALVAGKPKEAAEAGKALNIALDKMAGGLMTTSQQKIFRDFNGDLKENAEHIGANGDNIKHQREHFQLLSKNVYELVKVFGTKQTLYKDYCPMVKAIWLSETKAIKNPYYGNAMLTCGEVQESLQQ